MTLLDDFTRFMIFLFNEDFPTMPALEALIIKSYLFLSFVLLLIKFLKLKQVSSPTFLFKDGAKTSIFTIFFLFKKFEIAKKSIEKKTIKLKKIIGLKLIILNLLACKDAKKLHFFLNNFH